MSPSFGSLVFTPAVKALQERYGSRRQYARLEGSGSAPARLGPEESEFIGERDTFYMATLGSTGWPYVQHRGGPKGFLKVIDERTLAFADFRGNKQYISTGNLVTDNRVALILMDYPRQLRLKILGRAEIFEGEKASGWIEKVARPGLQGSYRKSLCNPNRSLRLELPATHCSSLHGGRNSRGGCARRKQDARTRAGKRETPEGACRELAKKNGNP